MKIKLILLTSAVLMAVSAGVFAQRRPPAETIVLPSPDTTGSITLEQALKNRRSTHRFKSTPVPMEKLGQLLWAAQGITDPNTGYRTAPSAGALYPIDIYVALSSGLYTYSPQNHSLTRVIDRDVRPMLYTAAYRQQVVKDASCCIILTSWPRKVETRFRRKGELFTALEAGHIAQNILLEAVAQRLGAIPIGGFDSKTVKRICRLSELQEALYMVCCGIPATALPPISAVRQTSSSALQAVPKPLRAVIVIGSQRFEDRELFKIQDVLEIAGIETDVASTQNSNLLGLNGNYANVDLSVSNIDIDKYDALIFVGGYGANEYFENRNILNMVRRANQQGKIIAASNISPAILANAGILRNKNVTSYTTERKKLEDAGANWISGRNVVVDGNIITASDYNNAGSAGGTSDYSDRFARTILRQLRKRQIK